MRLPLNRIHILSENFPTVGRRKPLGLALPWFGTISFQIRNNLEKFIKGVLDFCQLQVVFKSQNEFCNEVHLKEPVPQILTSGVVYKFQLNNQ